MKKTVLSIFLAPILGLMSQGVSATPIVAIDLSPLPGIQTMLTVAPGAPSFIASVVAYDDGSAVPGPTPVTVTSAIFDVTSSAAGVAALGPSATAGTFAGALAAALDAFSVAPTAPGIPLTPGLPPVPGSLGTVGYFDALPFPAGGALLPIDMALSPTMFIDLINFTVTPGVIEGITTLAVSPFPIFGVSPPVPVSVPLVPAPLPASVTVMATPTPEPSTVLLLSAGVLGFAGSRWRRSRHGG